MSDKIDPHKSLDFVRQKLKSDESEMDPDTREKLMQLRHRAMESSLGAKSNFSDWMSLPIIAFITAIVFVSLIYIKPNQKSQTDSSLEDLEIMISNDPIEFYENLEFLEKWKSINNKNDNKEH